MNYSETYFELDSEEATHCHHCHLICCVYIKGLVNAKDQSNACMCEMMSKGSKEALTVLIVTHVTYVKGVKSFTVLLITFLIFNQFSIWEKFCKAETGTFPTIPSNAIYVEGVESYFDFQPL